jgi:hypothetical protein
MSEERAFDLILDEPVVGMSEVAARKAVIELRKRLVQSEEFRVDLHAQRQDLAKRYDAVLVERTSLQAKVYELEKTVVDLRATNNKQADLLRGGEPKGPQNPDDDPIHLLRRALNDIGYLVRAKHAVETRLEVYDDMMNLYNGTRSNRPIMACSNEPDLQFLIQRFLNRHDTKGIKQ